MSTFQKELGRVLLNHRAIRGKVETVSFDERFELSEILNRNPQFMLAK